MASFNRHNTHVWGSNTFRTATPYAVSWASLSRLVQELTFQQTSFNPRVFHLLISRTALGADRGGVTGSRGAEEV